MMSFKMCSLRARGTHGFDVHMANERVGGRSLFSALDAAETRGCVFTAVVSQTMANNILVS